MSLTKVLLNELFEYKEGKLYNKVNRGRVKAGDVAGNLDTSVGKGYWRVKLYGKSYYVHRLIYMMFHGHIPRNKQVDHINRDRSDNRLENLRLVTKNENMWNSEGKGVFKHTDEGRVKRYQAYLTYNNKRKNLGYFHTEEEALEARRVAKEKYHNIRRAS